MISDHPQSNPVLQIQAPGTVLGIKYAFVLLKEKRTNLWGRGSLQPIDGWQVKLWSKMWGDFHSTPPTGEVESTS